MNKNNDLVMNMHMEDAVTSIHIPIGKFIKFKPIRESKGVVGNDDGWLEGIVQGDYKWHMLVYVRGENDWVKYTINKTDIYTGAVPVEYKKVISA